MVVEVIEYGVLSTRNIVECLLELAVPVLVVSHNSVVVSVTVSHIILSGGPAHIYEEHPPLPDWVLTANKPVLAICYGMQLLLAVLGGTVVRRPQPEVGAVEVVEVIDGVLTRQERWMYREDGVTTIPSNCLVVGYTVNGDVAAVRGPNFLALQYHPESQHLRDLTVFQRFLN